MDKRLVPWSMRVLAFGLLLIVLFACAGCSVGVVKLADAVSFVKPEGEPLKTDAVLENGKYLLQVRHDTGIFTLTDKSNGHVWNSTPDESELKTLKINGDWAAHIRSPFVLEYKSAAEFKNSKDTPSNAIRTNLAQSKAEVSLYRRNDAVEVAFAMPSLGMQFSFLLQLTEDGFAVDIPGNRLNESASNELRSVWPYPFFGAVLGRSEDGYVLLPDGPGMLMNFSDNDYPYAVGYREPVYGYNAAMGNPKTNFRSSVAYPVFGLKRGNNAYVAVIEQGEQYATIAANPSGPNMNSPYNWVTAEFNIRPDNFYASIYSQQSKQYVLDYMVRTDRRIRYYMLQGKEADYSGMARAYRGHLMKQQGARQLAPDKQADRIHLSLFMGTGRKAFIGSSVVTTTTFREAQEMLRELHGLGVNRLDLNLLGWNKGGYFPGEWPARFPPEPALGTADDLRELLRLSKQFGYSVYLDDNYVRATTEKQGFVSSRDASRNIKGQVYERLKGFNAFYKINPKLSLDYLIGNLPTYRDWGINGLLLSYTGGTPEDDYNEHNISPRKRTMGNYNEMYDRTAEALGSVKIFNGFAYTIGKVGHIEEMQLTGNFNAFRGETVPFYPMAVHGLVTYSGTPFNMLNDTKLDRLKAVEYGALPSYMLTYDNPVKLKDTYAQSFLFNGKFDLWKEDVAREFGLMNERLGGTGHLFIDRHTKLADGVYATVYEDGRLVVVNYGETQYRWTDGTIVPAHDYRVVRERS